MNAQTEDPRPLPILADLGREIESVPDAIREDALLVAIGKVVKSRRAALKASLGTRRPGWRQESEFGTALVTKPSRRPSIVDADAFTAWAVETHPDRTGTVERLSTTAIEDALAGRFDEPDEDEALGGALSEILRDLLDSIPGAVTRKTVVEESLADDVIDPSLSAEREDGTLVDRETGEIIPGIEVAAASDPAPRISPDREIVETLVDAIVDRLAPIPEEPLR